MLLQAGLPYPQSLAHCHDVSTAWLEAQGGAKPKNLLEIGSREEVSVVLMPVTADTWGTDQDAEHLPHQDCPMGLKTQASCPPPWHR